jgi:hypothetical protein
MPRAKPKPKSTTRAVAARKPTTTQAPAAATKSASRLIDARIRDLGGWRGETLAHVRALIHEADPEIIEECKWVKPTNPSGVPVWSHGGIVCTGEAYRNAVKLTFARGASLPDPSRLFNASLEGNARRAIDIHEGEKLDARAFKELVKAAVAANLGRAAPKKPAASAPRSSSSKAPARKKDTVLLSGGNPQIPKADGDAPVQAYIAAMPGWKREMGKRLDALIGRAVPGVRKAVKWNSPFYGVEGRGWFLSFHVFTRYVKVTFFRGASLRPLPPGASKQADIRHVDVHEDDLDEAQMAKWVRKAAALPGWMT